MNAAREPDPVHWERVRAGMELDPERFRGERSDLPTDAYPGDWCTIVLADDLGELRWTLVAREPGASSELDEQRRSSAPRRRRAAAARAEDAPLGGALVRLPQPTASVPPSDPGADGSA